jgi:putative sterol carrier protein
MLLWVFTPDVQNDVLFTPVRGLMKERKVISLLILPVLMKNEVIGTIGVDWWSRHEFTDKEISMPELEDVINEFLPLCEEDTAMKEFAGKRKFTVQYVVPDAQLQFFMTFQDGVVSCGGGKPETPATFTVTMNKQTFEDSMNDRIDAMSAALSGEIKFKGDRLKAMVLQQTRKDMARLWKLALKKV